MAEVKVEVLEGDLVLERNAVVVAERGVAEVKGRVVCEGTCTVKGSLRARSLRAMGDVQVEGDLVASEAIRVEDGSLYVEGSAAAERIKVEGNCIVRERVKAGTVSVGGSLRSRVVEAHKVNVGRTLSAEGVDAERVKVGRSANVSELKAKEVKVGGLLRASRLSAEDVSVGGSVEVKEMEVSSVGVGGALQLGSGSAEGVYIGGVLNVSGPLRARIINVGGTAKVREGLRGIEIRVGGSLELQGGAEVESEVIVGGTLRASGLLKTNSLRVGGEAEVEKVVAREVRVFYLRVGTCAHAEEVEVPRRGRVEGVVVAKRFYMKKRSSAEVVYAEQFECEEDCRVRELHATEAIVGRGSMVDALYYVKEPRVEEEARVVKAEKVAEVKPPPECTDQGWT